MYENRAILAAVILTAALTESVIAAEKKPRPQPAETAQMSPEEQRFSNYRRNLEATGYSGVKTVSFSQMRGKAAVSSIYDKKNKSGPLYFAEISTSRTAGPHVMFRVYTECEVTDMARRLPEQVIKVDDVRINAYAVCGSAGKDTTQMLFVPQSEAGKQAIYVAFKSKELVYVTLGGTEIPFDTIGFDAAWEEANKPVL